MLKTSITSGPTEVISSGTVITYAGNPINMTIDFSDWKLLIRLIFKEGTEDSIAGKTIENNSGIEIVFTGFNNALGSGSAEPIEIGNHQNRKLFLAYRIYRLQDVDRTIDYTIYRNIKAED